MFEASKVVEVIVGSATRKHHGDTITVDDGGNLLIHLGAVTAAIYPKGGWVKAYKAGNLIEEK